MNDSLVQELLLRSGGFTLACDTGYCPDVGPLIPDGPQEFSLRVTSAAITWYAWNSKHYAPIDLARFASLVALTDAVLDDRDVGGWPDTAVGRTITHLSLARDFRLHGAKQSSYDISHIMPRGFGNSRAWAALLRACAELVADAIAPVDLARWSFVLGAFSPSLLSPLLSTPVVMPVEAGAGLWGFPLQGRGIYLRVGQPPGRSELYRLAPSEPGATVHAIDDRGVESDAIATLTQHARWSDVGVETYRDAHLASVSVFVANGALTVRAIPYGRGVWVQRA